VVVGECGVPMDMNRRAAFRTKDWTWQRRMMDAMITALERANIGFTLWNYNPENDDGRGDGWNGENFSWFSNASVVARASEKTFLHTQDAKELDLGGRILDAVVRPYAAKTAGIPLKFEYEMATGTFAYSWAVPLSGSASGEDGRTVPQHPHGGGPDVQAPPLMSHLPLVARETEIFVPAQLAQGRKVIVEELGDDDAYVYDAARQTLFILPGARTGESGNGQVGVHKVRVRFEPAVGGELANDIWSDFGAPVAAMSVVLLALITYFVLERI